ncbi:MAG: hypothetical protein MK052_12380, partial [Alphaproteobacteria bacterium]|nr:hypothetical protein [Alphaproteobacteria bacterium]
MTSGAGRYAHASMASFVQDFFDTVTPISLPDGEYTKQDLVDNHGYTEDDFIISFQQLDIDSESADYASRVYIFNHTSFEISDDAVFVIENGGATKYVQNMAVHAYHDDFDFISEGLAQYGNEYVLQPAIDPYNIGRTLEIEYENKQNVPVVEEYTIMNFISDTNAAASENDGTLIGDAWPAMLDVIDALETQGTIEYDHANGRIIYGSNSSSVVGNDEDGYVVISGEDADVLYAGNGFSYLYGGTGGDMLYGGDAGDQLWGGDGSGH